jgi:hypothetical protein
LNCGSAKSDSFWAAGAPPPAPDDPPALEDPPAPEALEALVDDALVAVDDALLELDVDDDVELELDDASSGVVGPGSGSSVAPVALAQTS